MTRRRDLLILIGLFLALVLFTILGPGQADEVQPDSRPTTHSSAPGGALALLRWAQALGYDARRLEYRPFDLDDEPAALFVISPSQNLNRTQARTILAWVEAGGTLFLIEDSLFGGSSTLLEELAIDVRAYDDPDNDTLVDEIARAPVLQPALDDPPLREAPVRATRVLATERDDVAPLLGRPTAPVLLGLRHGAGYVYVASAPYPFTNEGLREPENAALVLNLLRRLPPGATLLFDEFHHGFFEPPSLRTLIFGNAWGWALVYALVVLAGYFGLTGRRFGRPVPLREELARRSSAEYVESMADLFQRGGKRAFIGGHYAAALKRRLARPYGISPQLDDAAFEAELARSRDLDVPALGALLARMRRANIDEAELLRAVAEADKVEARRR